MKKSRSMIVVTGNTWKEHLVGGYRTRQGALLATLARIDSFDRLIHVVETGYKATSSFARIENTIGTIEIFEAVLPNRIPELIFRPFGMTLMKRNYRVHAQLKSLLWDSEIKSIWSYSTPAGMLFQSLTGAKFLYDTIDYRVNDPNLSWLSRLIYRHEIGLARSHADIMTCNSDYAFLKHTQKRSKNCFLIRNGVDPGRFQHLRGQPKNGRVLFIGAISHWTDFHLLESLLKSLPSVKFDFYGIVQSAGDSLNKLKQFQNFTWHGKIPAEEVPKTMSSYSLALVPYNARVTQQTMGDSMKMFEYLAAGVPIVSTPFQPRLDVKFGGLVNIGNDEPDFIRLVASLLENPVDSAWMHAAWEFVEQHSWERRIMEALNLFNI